MNTKKYANNEDGKREFVDEVIKPMVCNEGHFKDAIYVSNDYGEYIMLYRYGEDTAAYKIDITANSIKATVWDFCKQFLKYLKEELN